jgi:murein DD-endopeptidase MepM/ murein hydrolase activator NlpD
MRRMVLVAGVVGAVGGAAPAARAAGAGGMYASDRATVGTVVCVARCAGRAAAWPGGVVRVGGARMVRVRDVVFLGGPGERDDVRVRARRRRARSVDAPVPRRAVSGRVRVRNADGNPSPASATVLRVARGTPAAAPAPAPPAPSPAPAPPPPGGGVFPVRGPYSLGGPEAGFGAGRGDHAHEGHDVSAACGTPLVAARAGRVVMRRYQSRAGHYVVIDDAGGTSQVYMHLQAPATVAQDASVAAGQPIGAVGNTGASRGCHLHFELWPAPGWQRGGRPIDPLPALRAWAAAGG